MDVRAETQRSTSRTGLGPLSTRPASDRPPSRQRVGEALGEWQAAEIAASWRYPQCRGLSQAQLEDLYQETVLALLNRPFFSEEHLRNALRVGLRNRALHVHRDERRRGQILAAHAPEAHLAAVRHAQTQQPEQAALAREDGLVVLEFASGLSELEQQVYALEAEGLRYRAIAPILGVSVNRARKVSRELQEKYARFQLLHDTGRLCGYRAPTIRALLAGEETSEQLARAAFAHLRSCPQCRDEHRTNAARLKRSFHDRAAALLPLPALLDHRGLQGLVLRGRLLAHRLLAGGVPGAGVRERALALAAGGAGTAKVAAGVATVVAVAGGTFSAAGALHGAPVGHHRHRARSASVRASTPRAVVVSSSQAVGSSESTAAPVQERSQSEQGRHAARREPGGFAFLGVPGDARHGAARASAASVSEEATPPSVSPGSEPARAPAARTGASGTGSQDGGGPFSP